MKQRTATILQFIKTFRTQHGYAPTRREIGRACHVSTSVVSYHLAILQDEGRLTVARDVARGIVLVEPRPEPRLELVERFIEGEAEAVK